MLFNTQKKIFYKITSVVLLAAFLNELLFSTLTFALTGGPGQPEFQRFTPANAGNMVNVFTGDFNYNIPLFDVGGYPLNLSYNSDVRMDEEASWVGLGWNLNIGSVTRQMRGLPDDFKGDAVEKYLHTKPNYTYGMSASVTPEGEALGVSLQRKTTFGLGMYYNNYSGLNFEPSISPTLSIGKKNSSKLDVGLGISSSSEGGLNITPSVGLQLVAGEENSKVERGTFSEINGSIGFNSRQGLNALQLGATFNKVATTFQYNHSFADPTYVPSIAHPSTNTSITLGLKYGGELFGITGWFKASGYYNEQRIAQESISTPAYGYYYSQEGKGNGVMLDFNREKDGTFSLQKPAIAPAYFTPDAFSVNAQGLSDGFKVQRGDIGFVFDKEDVSYTTGVNMGVEFGTLNAVHPGIDETVVSGESSSRSWSSFNYASLKVGHVGYDATLYEPAYFKSVSQASALTNKNLYDSIGGNMAARFKMGGYGDGFNFPLSPTMEVYAPTSAVPFQSIALPSSMYRNKGREPRQKAISAMTVAQARAKGFLSTLSTQANDATQPDNFTMPAHHFGEFMVTKEDGKRYVFGLPTYNRKQKDVTFSMGGKAGFDYTSHLISYAYNQDNSSGNKNGIDRFFSYTSLPPYAHSHLLTSVLSSDYEDISQDGPTPDDPGDYVKFNYSKHLSNYKWRMPFEENKAMYNAGYTSDSNDDKASYSYGEKEIWYPDSIASKEFIAVFSYDVRHDGYEVIDENGGMGTRTQKLLKKVSKYGRIDYAQNGVNAIPLNAVEFEYDYSLCPDIPNNNGSGNGNGKLTLKKVFITSGKSQRGRLNPYVFNYSSVNPSYNSGEYDRWGYYKTQGSIPNSEFPYAEQDSALANQYARAWRLTEIILPSGGSINVEYESDDYAYVQDKRAMEMFKVVAVNDSATFPVDGNKNKLWKYALYALPNLYLFFPLKNPIGTSSEDLAGFKKNYFDDLSLAFTSQMFFKFKVRIGIEPTDYEYITGYAEVDGAGLANLSDGFYQHGYVKLKSVNIGDKAWTEDVHPISKAAWQMGRVYLPRKVWDLQQDPYLSLSDVKGIANTLLNNNFVTQIENVIQGPNRTIALKQYGKDIDTTRCWMRLFNPVKKKFGGGSRVKRILMNDRWATLSNVAGAMNQQSGYTYDYTVRENERTISSGVASYEPLIGSEENPLHKPIFFNKKNVLVPDDRFYIEEPLGEMVFPSPSVGYSKVTVTPLHTNAPVSHRSGSIVHEFYTAKDFPVYTYRTPISPVKRGKTALSVLVNMFGLGKIKDYMTVSQGFSVEINDMHGKQKAVWNYAQGQDSPISGQEFFYHTEPKNSQRLSNTISLIDKKGMVQPNKTFGLEFMATADFRESITTTDQFGAQLNVDAFLVGFFPAIIATIWPQISGSETAFRSSSFTKVVSRTGILKSVVNHDLNASVPTVNLLYEALTGEPVLTATLNEFKDTIYSLKYPAYWAYENMGMAAANQSYRHHGSITFTNGAATVPAGIFRQADELILRSGAYYAKVWVLQSTGASIYAVNTTGQQFSGTFDECFIYRSGRKNLLSAGAMAFTSRNNPLQSGTLSGMTNTRKILDVSASEFSQHWQLLCNADTSCSPQPGTVVNPFLTGILGHWRPKRTWAYVTPRDSGHIRFAGAYQNFTPFWNPSGGNDFIKNPTNWVWSATATKFLPQGATVEERDALGRFASRIYGFCGEKLTAEVSNARYTNIVYDGFEDYLSPCGCEQQPKGSLFPEFITIVCPLHGTSACKQRQPLFFTGYSQNVITNLLAHTGDFSLCIKGIKVNSISEENLARIVSPALMEGACYPNNPTNNLPTPYLVDTCDCAGHFAPQSIFPQPCNNQKYVFSCWFRRLDAAQLTPYPSSKVTNYNSDSVVTMLLGSTLLIPTDTTFSPIIDGWQQLNYTFEIPGNCSGNQSVFKVFFKNKFDNTYLFIDDIRIHPFNSNMRSFVYDWKNFRHVATLDENNFASMFQYNSEGNLVSVKKETERGIVTVSEYRQEMKTQ